MMNDVISRQRAIDALKEHRALYCDNTPDTFSKLSYAEKSRVDELDTAIATLINLPSAESEQTKMIKEIRKWINSGNRGSADYFIVDKIEEIINKYE